MTELKPCPFCGNSAMMFPPTCNNETPYNAADRAYPIVRCMHCAAQVGGNNWDQRGKSAIEFWNTRRVITAPAPVTVSEDSAKVLSEALKKIWKMCQPEAELLAKGQWADSLVCGIGNVAHKALEDYESARGEAR